MQIRKPMESGANGGTGTFVHYTVNSNFDFLNNILHYFQEKTRQMRTISVPLFL